jgi:hypothetical protein
MAKVNPGEMLPQERQQWILDRLRQRGRVVAVELATEFAVSEDSVRRDLRELAALAPCHCPPPLRRSSSDDRNMLAASWRWHTRR